MITNNLTEQLKTLVDLQRIDTQLYLCRVDLAARPREKQKLTDAFEKTKGTFGQADQDLKGQQVRLKELENDLSTKETTLRKLAAQQAQVKTNQEYTAMTHEIKGLEADKSVLEDQILQMMDKIEELKKEVAKQKAALAGEEKKLKDSHAQIDVQIGKLEHDIARLEGERKQFLPKIDQELLMTYERILIKREGVAVAALENYSCGGCNMTFPPQTVNEIRLKEKLIFCETCGRILYEYPS